MKAVIALEDNPDGSVNVEIAYLPLKKRSMAEMNDSQAARVSLALQEYLKTLGLMDESMPN
jgi:hypothetical protein